MRPLHRLIVVSLVLIVAASIASADTVFIGTLPYKDVQVKGIKGDQIQFLTSSGNETSKPVKDVTRLQLNDETSLNTAEEAYAGQKWGPAVDGYTKTIRATNKDWVKDWCSVRLLTAAAADKGNRFDAIVTAWLVIMQHDPATAIKNKPTVPQEKSTFLDSAATEVQRVINETKLSDEQKQSLLAFLLEIHRARDDQKAVGETVEQLKKYDTSETSATGNDAAANKALGDLKLGIANVAFEKKDYKTALDTIEQNRGAFTEPKQQAEALWILAGSRYALAQPKNDPKELKDVALCYMRIVAHFKDAPNAPHVADSLLATGEILEKIKDNDGALSVYTQLSKAYPETPAGAKAKEAIDRLKPKQG